MLESDEEEHLLEAGVVPGVLEDLHAERVLDFSSTSRAVTTICNFKEKTKPSRGTRVALRG